MDQWTEIRRKVLMEGASKRSIYRDYGIGHQALAKTLGHAVSCTTASTCLWAATTCSPARARSHPRRRLPQSRSARRAPSHSSCCTGEPLSCWPVRQQRGSGAEACTTFQCGSGVERASARGLCVAWPPWPTEEPSPMPQCHFIYPSYISDGPLVRVVAMGGVIAKVQPRSQLWWLYCCGHIRILTQELGRRRAVIPEIQYFRA